MEGFLWTRKDQVCFTRTGKTEPGGCKELGSFGVTPGISDPKPAYQQIRFGECQKPGYPSSALTP